MKYLITLLIAVMLSIVAGVVYHAVQEKNANGMDEAADPVPSPEASQTVDSKVSPSGQYRYSYKHGDESALLTITDKSQNVPVFSLETHGNTAYDAQRLAWSSDDVYAAFTIEDSEFRHSDDDDGYYLLELASGAITSMVNPKLICGELGPWYHRNLTFIDTDHVQLDFVCEGSEEKNFQRVPFVAQYEISTNTLTPPHL